jgi:hypothetical protein
MSALFTFETTHHALWAEELAIQAEIPVMIVPAPPAANARCNLALETLPDEERRLAELLRQTEVPFGRWSGG